MCKNQNNNKDNKDNKKEGAVQEILYTIRELDESCNKDTAKRICIYLIAALFPIALIILSISLFCFTCKHSIPTDTRKECLCTQEKQVSKITKDTNECKDKDCWQITICSCEQSFEIGKDTTLTDSSQINVDVHLEIKSQAERSDWLMLVSRLIFVTLLLTACVIMFVKFLKHLDKLAEQDAKYNERLTDEVIRIYKEEKEHERLAERTRVGLLEKQGKAIIDEETRAKEHQRKLEVMDKEWIADLSNKVLEIAKVQVSNKTLDEKRAQQWISELIHTISNLSSKK